MIDFESSGTPAGTAILRAPPGEICTSDAWEAAYLRFESPEEEAQKFERRLGALGARDWSRDAAVVELFCGRGSGLVALDRLGFRRLEGIDLSPSLLRACPSSARLLVADCRDLPLADGSRDIAIVQGGLHHLSELPRDLERVLAEIERILVPGGIVMLVEPWRTPFLDLVHAACRSRLLRRAWRKLDALATMIDQERATYERWLARPDEILAIIESRFAPLIVRRSLGKLSFVGSRR